MPKEILEIAAKSKSWAFHEAYKILEKIEGKTPQKGYVLFEAGYGPSGLPHIGTFVEVLRPSMVRNAFQTISDIPTKLFCISDDMDGLRSIPSTIQDAKKFEKYIDMPLCDIPDPFGSYNSYAAYMNGKLRQFLDAFGFDYEFISSSEYYKTGKYNDALIMVLEKYEQIMELMLPTLGKERQKTYSPFMPICPVTKKVLQNAVLEIDKQSKLIKFKNAVGDIVTSEVTNGLCKLQWKPDMGMRWSALDVDFEMYGKDHLANAPLYTKISEIIGGKAPSQSFFELFLDEDGKKISKSKGNGLSIEEWLRYGNKDSLSYFMYQSPKKAKRLHFDIIPKSIDEYLNFLKKYHKTDDILQKIDNPVYHVHRGNPPQFNHNTTYSLLLNLISACNTDDRNVIWGYIHRQDPSINPENCNILNELVDCAINYYHDFIKPSKQFRHPSEKERKALLKLSSALEGLANNVETADIQNIVYSIGNEMEFELSEWFKSLYEILLGATKGPRFGSFISLYGIKETVELIHNKCDI